MADPNPPKDPFEDLDDLPSLDANSSDFGEHTSDFAGSSSDMSALDLDTPMNDSAAPNPVPVLDELPAMDEVPLEMESASPETTKEIIEEVTSNSPPPNPTEIYERLDDYAKSSHVNIQSPIFFPFHLRIEGKFDLVERDRLLRIIGEQSLGITSAEIDLQIQMGTVFIPRISEYTAVRIVQDLRDSNLNFKVSAAEREDFDAHEKTNNVAMVHSVSDEKDPYSEIKILSRSELTAEDLVFDSIAIERLVKSDAVEAEKSQEFQDFLSRMTLDLKIRARKKGAFALIDLKRKLTPLRLPSQYSVEVSASLVKKKS